MVHENRHLINCLRGDLDRTLLMRAVSDDNDIVFDYLIKKLQDFSAVDRNGWNIIYHIVWFDRDDEISESQLIKLSNKTNVESLINKRNVHGDTPLHVAARWNNYRTIARLISMGSDVNVRNKYNQLPDEHNRCDDETKRIIRQSR